VFKSPVTAAIRQHPRSIVFYLVVLALVSLVPAVAFSAVLLQRNNDAQNQLVETLMVGTARSMVQAVEREIVAKIATLKILASSDALLNGDFRAFHTRTKAALAGTGTYVFLLDSRLYTLLSTRLDYGAPEVKTNDVASAERALGAKSIVISDLVLGRVSQQWVFNVLQPVILDGRPPMVLAISQDAAGLSSALLANKLPSGWSVALIDKHGIVVAASPGTANTGDTFSLVPADIVGSSGWVTVHGQDTDYRAVVQTSPLTGWRLIAWAPASVLAKPITDAVWSLVIGGVLLTALITTLVVWLSRRIGKGVRRLAADAQLYGRGEDVPPRLYRISELDTVGRAITDAAEERRAAEAEVRFLMRELAHRSKNQMTVITAMAKQTARTAASVPQFVESFERRIWGLARSTDLLLANGKAGVRLGELVARQIEPFRPSDASRLEISGPLLMVNAQAAQILGMAMHELATNAVKYGAFAEETGRLAVRWSSDGARLQLVWREHVTTRRRRSSRTGFGTTVLNSMVGGALGADVQRTLHRDGIEWRFAVPLSALDPRRDLDQRVVTETVGGADETV
jgi:two-component sensor histidine kinase